MSAFYRALPALVFLAACDAEELEDTGPAPAAGPPTCGYSAMPDLDADPDRVEVDLVASNYAWDPGTGVGLAEGLAFNESVPGPLLEAKLGDEVTVNFRNDTGIDMSIHWHGLRVRPEMDGILQMIGDPVEPGESFTYTFTVVDTGFYWFHTHMDTAVTIEAGLYAPIIFRAPGEVAPDCDQPLVLDDILLDEDSLQIAPPDTDMMQLMGRLGTHLLANGETNREISWTAGQTNLLRLVNASNARYWDLALEGHSFTVVGTDGGFLAEPYEAERLVMAPGERLMVVVKATGEPGETYRLMNRRFQLHEHGGEMVEFDPLGEGENPVMSFVYSDSPAITGSGWTQPEADVPSFTEAPATLGHHWVLNEDMMGGTVTIDGETWPNVPPFAVASNVDTTFIVENASEMHHPFHIHGNRFAVLSVGDEPVVDGGWKDTFDIPPRTTITIASNLDNPGEWMYHCHILEHADDGMAGLMTVDE